MTTQTTYTVINPSSGEPEGRGLTAPDAAQIVLNHDGRDFEIRPAADGIGFELWTRQQVANVKWGRTVVFSVADTLEAAEAGIYAKVIAAGWRGHPDVMTDADYDAMLAEIARDAE